MLHMGRMGAFLSAWIEAEARSAEEFQELKSFFLAVGGSRALFTNEGLWGKLVVCISRVSSPSVRAAWLRDHLSRQVNADHGHNASRLTNWVLKGEANPPSSLTLFHHFPVISSRLSTIFWSFNVLERMRRERES